MEPKQFTIVFIIQEQNILLGLKKRGIGVGKWNGFGGKVEANETIEDAAKRELREECGLNCTSLTKVGVIQFDFVGQPPLWDVHVFKSHEYSGEPQETEEMKPQWFSFEDIPYKTMWPDDEYWYPYLLSGKRFNAYFKFQGMEYIIEQRITELPSLDDHKI